MNRGSGVPTFTRRIARKRSGLPRKRRRSCVRLNSEYRMIAADGRPVWFHDEIASSSNPENRSVQRGLMIDITERKQSQEVVQSQQTKLQILFDLMPAMIWFKDTKNRILRVNKQVAEAAGKSDRGDRREADFRNLPSRGGRILCGRPGGYRFGNIQTWRRRDAEGSRRASTSGADRQGPLLRQGRESYRYRRHGAGRHGEKARRRRNAGSSPKSSRG